jgi:dihydrodipicolinate synthase/N-acetylneuraminate lyase
MAYTAEELKGVFVMMMAFATPDANDLRCRSSIDVENLEDGVNRLIDDGIHMITTTSGSGESFNLFFEEFQTLVGATVEVVNKRVPLFVGVTSENARDTVRKIEFARDAGAEGVLCGVPYYWEMAIPNVIEFYRRIAELFPDMSISIYHNPTNHRVHIPVSAFQELVKIPNLVAMKDSHRTPIEFMRLHKIIHGKIAHFVNENQLYPYYEMGASGCWSYDVNMGPWPVLRAYEACVDGDRDTAARLMGELTGEPAGDGRRGANGIGEGGNGILPQQFAGYINRGPARPPYFVFPPGAEERAKKRADRWLALCEKYRPEVEAWRAVHER